MSGAVSRNFARNTFFEPPEPRNESSKVRFEVPPESFRLSNRRTTLYDAVAGTNAKHCYISQSLIFAGRVNSRGLHPPDPFASTFRDTASSGARTLRPEEILLRRGRSTKQHPEDESYFANEQLPPDRPLPSSDMLSAIHAYAADFYKYQTKRAGKQDNHSMDETALLAMGILVEEMANEALGETGDLVLVEGELSDEDEQETRSEASEPAQRRKRQRKRSDTTVTNDPVTSSEHARGARQKSKRRRLRQESDADGHATSKEK